MPAILRNCLVFHPDDFPDAASQGRVASIVRTRPGLLCAAVGGGFFAPSKGRLGMDPSTFIPAEALEDTRTLIPWSYHGPSRAIRLHFPVKQANFSYTPDTMLYAFPDGMQRPLKYEGPIRLLNIDPPDGVLPTLREYLSRHGVPLYIDGALQGFVLFDPDGQGRIYSAMPIPNACTREGDVYRVYAPITYRGGGPRGAIPIAAHMLSSPAVADDIERTLAVYEALRDVPWNPVQRSLMWDTIRESMFPSPG